MTSTLRRDAPEHFLEDDQGHLGAPSFPVGSVCPAKTARIKGRTLEWVFTLHPCFHEDVSSQRMLDRFIRIESARDVVNFAKMYGVLSVCPHGLPPGHCPERTSLPVSLPHGHGSDKASIFSEPLDGWFRLVQFTRALLRLAAALHGGRKGVQEDWDAVLNDPYFGRAAKADRQKSGAAVLVGVVNQWLIDGNITPTLILKERQLDDARLLFDGDTFSTLGLQLLLAIRRMHGWALCSGCGELYLVERKPQAGRDNYCVKCRPTVANRNRRRRWLANNPAKVAEYNRQRREARRRRHGKARQPRRQRL